MKVPAAARLAFRLPDVSRGGPVTVHVDGVAIDAFAGETIAVALLASGTRMLRRTRRQGAPRGLFCGMGACFDCVLTVNGRRGVRACTTPVHDGMIVQTGVTGP